MMEWRQNQINNGPSYLREFWASLKMYHLTLLLL